MNKRQGILSSIDWPIIFTYLLLVIIGFLALYSSSHDSFNPEVFDFSQEHGKQIIWIGISLVLAFIVINLDGQFFRSMALPSYIVVLILLALVLVIGTKINGAQAWIKFGGFTIQPAEFAKLAISLVLAKYISRQETRIELFQSKLYAFIMVIIPVGLILLQPDVGSAIIALSFIFPLYREGMSGSIILIGIVALFIGVLSIVFSYSTIDYWFFGNGSTIWLFIIALAIFGALALFVIRNTVIPRYRRKLMVSTTIWVILSIFFSLGSSYIIKSDKYLKQHHKDRIELLLGVADEKLQQKRGYNMKMARTAIGSGGWLGKGFASGPMTEYNFVPEQNTDFIFTVIGEEYGFLGSLFVIALYVFLILRLIRLSERQRSHFSRVFGYCVTSIFFMHFLINIGMVLGLAPVIGIPLPFISKGGSALISFTLMIFIFVRLDGERFNVIERIKT